MEGPAKIQKSTCGQNTFLANGSRVKQNKNPDKICRSHQAHTKDAEGVEKVKERRAIEEIS